MLVAILITQNQLCRPAALSVCSDQFLVDSLQFIAHVCGQPLGKRHKPQAGYAGLEWPQSSSFLNSSKMGPEAELWRGHRMFSAQGYPAPEIAKARHNYFISMARMPLHLDRKF